MSLNGTGARFVSSVVADTGIPGGSIVITLIAAPTNTPNSYPANGEPLSVFLLGSAAAGGLNDSRIKIPSGVRPDTATIEPSGGHNWVYDGTQGTMGTLRCYTAGGATPTEHATGVYSGTENTTLIRVTLWFPLYGDMSR